ATRSGMPYQRGLRIARLRPIFFLKYTIPAMPRLGCDRCARIRFMSQAAPAITHAPAEIVRRSPVSHAPNGICYAISREIPISEAFADMVWKQVEAGVRGETSLDAWESRKLATGSGPDTEKYKNEFFAATFADSLSIYMLSLFLDVDYYDLRERDYPLLAPSPL